MSPVSPVGKISKEGRILAVAGFVVVAVAVGMALKFYESEPQVPAAQAPVSALLSAPHSAQVSARASRSVRAAPSWREAEKGLPYLHRKDVSWFLKRTRIPSFEAELNRAVEIGPAAWIEGCYAGTVSLDDGRKWPMTTQISLQKGNTSVELSENGATFLHSIGSDGLRDLHKLSGGSAAVILEASENIFFQLYPVRNTGFAAGNVYLRGGSGKVDFGGTVLLERQACTNG